MVGSADAGHYFETDAALADRERKTAKAENKYGHPIVLKAKILAAIADPRSPHSTVLVAEAGGSVRRVNVDDEKDNKVTYRGPTAPVSCVAVGGPATGTLFAGSWDKIIWSWDLASRMQGIKFVGHADFVKAVVCATLLDRDKQRRHLLISGGADKKMIVWDAISGNRLHTLQDGLVNMLAVQHLAVDPVPLSSASEDDAAEEEICIVSASSDPHIRRWRIRFDSWEQIATPGRTAGQEERTAIREHETTVYKLVFDHYDVGDDDDDIGLWTASGDGTVKCLSRKQSFASRETFEAGSHVRALAVTEKWVVTAGRDEDVKFWERASGELHCSLIGHYDEVTDLIVLGHGSEERVCSVSIDGTIRTWPTDKAKLHALVEEQSRPATTEEKSESDKAPVGTSGLTADEEAELDALLDDDE